jgi:hypothetical protein
MFPAVSLGGITFSMPKPNLKNTLPDWLEDPKVATCQPKKKTLKDLPSTTTIWRNGAIWRENKECAIQLKDLKPIP